MESFFGFSQNDNKKEKNHYFIGNIFDDENHIRILKKVTKKLKQRSYVLLKEEIKFKNI